MLGRILVIVGGLLVVALFAALVAPHFVDWTDFRRDFELQASRIIGKKVVVHGEVDARLLPFPSVTMTDVRVGEEGGEALVTAEKFSMETELAPFLSGEALIYNMRIEKPRVKLRLTEDGTLDWVKTGTPQIPAATVVLESVTITDGEVLFVDEQTGRNRQLTGLDLNLSARTLAGPWRVTGKGAIDGEPGSFVMSTSVPEDGKIFLKLRLLPDSHGIVAELDGQLGLEGLRPQYAGSFRIRERYRSESLGAETVEERKSSAPRISGRFALANDRLRVDEYEFHMGSPDDPYIVKGEATIDAGRKPEFLLTATGQQIDMSRFGTSDEGTQVAIPVRERLRALLTLLADIPIPQMPGKASINLPALLAENTVIRDIRLEMRPAGDGWQIDHGQAQLPGRTTLEAKGKLTLRGRQAFSGELLLASSQPSGFAEWVTGAVPATIRALKTAGFSAHVELTPDVQRFENLEIAFGPASLRGRLEHQSGDDAALSAELTGNRFDLDTVVALGGLLTGEAAVESIMTHRLAAKLKFDEFSAFGLEGRGVDASFALAAGGVSDARVVVSDFYGGRLALVGGFSGVPDDPTGNARITLKAEDPSALLALAAARLPSHPVLHRLAANASYFAQMDLAAEVKLGEGDWPIEATFGGTANGSKLAAKLAAQTLDLVNSGGLVFDLSLENPDAWILLGQAGLSTLPIDADRDGKLVVRIGQPAESDPQIELVYSAETTKFSLKGQSALDALGFLNGSYAVSVESVDLAPYLLMNGIAVPRMAEGLPLSATASVYTTPEVISIENITGASGDNGFSGTASVDRVAGQPLFRGELKLGYGDMSWLAEAIYGEVTDPLTGELSAQDVPAHSGLPVSLDIALSADTFALGAFGEVRGFNAKLAASPGRIRIDGATGEYVDGRFLGNAELGNTDGNAFFRARFAIQEATLMTEFWHHGGEPVASALSNMSLVVDATGKSPQAMLETATGSGNLDLTGLRISGINAKALPAILAGADAIKGEVSEENVKPIVEGSLFDGSLEFQKLRIPFTITGAKLRADKISTSNASTRIEAEGSLSLKDAHLDARLTATFDAGEQALTGAEPIVGLSWQGPFIKPEMSLDVTQMTSFLSLRKFEQERRNVEILQARLAEQQRLRRESALYRARAAERERLKQRELDNARILEKAQEALKEKARKDAEERRLREALKRADTFEAIPAQ